jgi:putative transposon-encoded protein
MTVVVPIGKAVFDVWLLVTVGFAVQLSVTVGGVQITVSVVPTAVCVILIGQLVITGGMVSFVQGFVTVTVNEQTDLFLASVAVYITVVTPIGNTAPELWLLVTIGGGGEQLSVTVGTVHVPIAVVPVVVKEILGGQWAKTGGMVSFAHGFVTVIVKEHIFVLFLASIAVYITVVTPIGNAAPELWVLVTEGVLQLSVAVSNAHVAMAVVPVVVKAIFVGQLAKTGGMVSLAHGFVTVTVNEHVFLLFFASVAV